MTFSVSKKLHGRCGGGRTNVKVLGSMAPQNSYACLVYADVPGARASSSSISRSWLPDPGSWPPASLPLPRFLPEMSGLKAVWEPY